MQKSMWLCKVICSLISASVLSGAFADISSYLAAERAAKEKGAQAYILDGLVAHWDGIENNGYGQPRVNTEKHPWKELTGNRADIDTVKCKWGNNPDALYINGYWNSSKMAVFDATLPQAHTVEVCVRATHSAGTGYIVYGIPFFVIAHNPNNGSPGLEYAKPCFGGYGLTYSSSNGGAYHYSPLRGATYTVSHSGSLTDKISCYISGARTSTPTPKELSTGTAEASLASNNSSSSQGINAYYYSIRIYNRVLSAEEVFWNSVVDNHRFDTLDAGCITKDNSVNPKSTAYSSALSVSPEPFDAFAAEGIDFSSQPFKFSIILR